MLSRWHSEAVSRSLHILALALNTPFADLIGYDYVNTSVPAMCSQSPGGEQKSTDTSDCNISVERIDPGHASQTRSQQIKQNVVDRNIDLCADKYSTDTPLTKSFDISEVCKEFNICERKQLVNYQKNDTNLDKVRSYVIYEPQDTQSYFMYDSDLLYRVYEKPNVEVLHQIVVPQQLRSTILSLGHDILVAGHLGNRKTRDRIMQHFFWPGIFNDIAEYFSSCPECQMATAKGRVPRAPVASIPPIDEPFQRITLDFVGPMPLSESKNRFVLFVLIMQQSIQRLYL